MADLYEVGTLGAGERYHSLEFKAQKAFSKGWNFLVAYVYIREKTPAAFQRARHVPEQPAMPKQQPAPPPADDGGHL